MDLRTPSVGPAVGHGEQVWPPKDGWGKRRVATLWVMDGRRNSAGIFPSVPEALEPAAGNTVATFLSYK